MTNRQHVYRTLLKGPIALSALVFLPACATPREQTLRQTHTEVGEAFPSHTVDPATLTSLDDYLAAAYQRNPQLRAAYHRWEAALEGVPQARTLEDPSLTGTLFLEQMDTRYKVSLSQMFPAWGTLRLRTNQAGARAQAAMHAFEAERLDLFERVVRALMEYQYLEQATRSTAEHVRLLEELQEVITARYRSGSTQYPDWIKIRIEQERAQDRLAGLQDQRLYRSEVLAALLHLQPDAPLPWISNLAFSAPPADAIRFEDLLPQLDILNPELRAMDASIEVAEHAVHLARRRGWPRLMIGAEWMVMEGMEGQGDDTDVGLMAGITLPLWRSGYRAARRAAQAEQEARQQDRQNRHNQVRAELAMATTQYQDASRRLERFNTSLLPQAQQAIRVARQAYADGRMEFAGMIDAYRTLLDLQLLAARAEADRGIALADIGCCLGDPETLFEKEP